MSERLTEAQRRHLERIATGGRGDFPHAGWFHTRPEQKLEERGLIRCWTETKPLGGGSAMSRLSVSWHFAELTEAGRAALHGQARG